MNRCSICHAIVGAADAATKCPACEQDYHESCWTDLGGCATYGCEAAAAIEKAPPTTSPRSGWGDEKVCPKCQKAIGASLLRCRCGARFPSADPMTRAEYRAWLDRQQSLRGARRTLVWLFLGSLPGLAAPVLGAIAGVYAARRRRLLVGRDGIYLAMGYGAAALGLGYLAIIATLALGG